MYVCIHIIQRYIMMLNTALYVNTFLRNNYVNGKKFKRVWDEIMIHHRHPWVPDAGLIWKWWVEMNDLKSLHPSVKSNALLMFSFLFAFTSQNIVSRSSGSRPLESSIRKSLRMNFLKPQSLPWTNLYARWLSTSHTKIYFNIIDRRSYLHFFKQG